MLTEWYLSIIVDRCLDEFSILVSRRMSSRDEGWGMRNNNEGAKLTVRGTETSYLSEFELFIFARALSRRVRLAASSGCQSWRCLTEPVLRRKLKGAWKSGRRLRGGTSEVTLSIECTSSSSTLLIFYARAHLSVLIGAFQHPGTWMTIQVQVQVQAATKITWFVLGELPPTDILSVNISDDLPSQSHFSN